MTRGLAWIAALLLPLRLAAGDLKLKPIHPDEPVEQTLNERFTTASALAAIEAVRGWLESFRILTSAACGRVDPAAWKRIGHTDWETQNLGFANQPRTIEGALRLQNWRLKQALYRLTLMENALGKAPPRAVDESRREAEQAEREFQTFWDSLTIAD